jgi:hypothetical protein
LPETQKARRVGAGGLLRFLFQPLTQAIQQIRRHTHRVVMVVLTMMDANLHLNSD